MLGVNAFAINRPTMSLSDWPKRALVVVACLPTIPALAEEPLANRGNDPFMQVSSAIAGCTPPRGPFVSEKEWLAEAHYRIERGNSCWIAGRCRLPNSYDYDKEIAESVTRRLNALNTSTQWREKTSLWLTLQRRFIYVDGCVARDFDKARFLSQLGETADVETVIDRTVAKP
ncbi:hypothetical protein AWB68_06074 [Caballeronia choica]|uniref:Uncharacterized protein n=2 Tax=Caballeronia choica TaxID=326476 RepID=A0A158KJS1_9BURK|nr:hypothetical protein AWB68_06074 [Caballeronia choica]